MNTTAATVPTWVLTHSVDDYEAQRTAALRAVDAQVRLLADGLHAQQNGSPEVATEYMERALDALRTVAENLRHAPLDPRST